MGNGTKKIMALVTAALLFASATYGGSLDAPAGPASAGSAMFTVSDIYNRLTTGAAGAKRSGAFSEPSAGPGSTGKTFDELMAAAPSADNTNGAAPGDVRSGKTFWGLRTDGSWGPRTGTIVTQTLSPASTVVSAGYYAATTLPAVDADLVSANIKRGITIFGIAGSNTVVDTSTATAVAGDIRSGKTAYVNGNQIFGSVAAGGNITGTNGTLAIPIPAGIYPASTATASDTNLVAGNIKNGVSIFGVTGSLTGGDPKSPVPKSGQTLCYDDSGVPTTCTGTGQDGAWQKGVTTSPRFTDNGNGTVTDNLSGLIWLKNANCTDLVGGITGGINTWFNALTWSNSLASGSCGLTDGSTVGQWRLPNAKELLSLIDFGNVAPPLPSGHPFTGVQMNYYWSSTSDASFQLDAWQVSLDSADMNSGFKFDGYNVWPVRGGQ